MPKRKDELKLPSRTPTYVSREVGAAELCISLDTWDVHAREGGIIGPPTCYIGGVPRWRWNDVDAKLQGKITIADPKEPYFRVGVNGKTTKEQRKAA